MADDCLFCQIVEGKVPSTKVHETDTVLAFEDINPGAPTHVLVIPKEHIVSAHELTAEHGSLLAEIFQVTSKVAEGAGTEAGYRIVTNIGAGAGQSVFHIHFHVMGGRPMGWPPG